MGPGSMALGGVGSAGMAVPVSNGVLLHVFMALLGKLRGQAPGAVDVTALFREHAAFLARVIERITGPGPHVEDILQETFLTLHVKGNTLPADTPWRGWLYRVAVHQVQHHRRSYARRTRLGDAVTVEPTVAEAPSAHDVAETRSNAARVRAAVATIPLLQREVFVLFELEGVGGTEIAALLGIPENTVWSRLRVARDAFKAALVKDGGGPRVAA